MIKESGNSRNPKNQEHSMFENSKLKKEFYKLINYASTYSC